MPLSVDHTIPLAVAVQAERGCMAILIGSGISRSAAIPTGWEVTLDLARRVAAIRGEADPSDPAAWFETTFGEPPTYDRMLEMLGSMECALAGGQFGRFELTPLAGLPEDGSHDEVSVAQRGIQTAGC